MYFWCNINRTRATHQSDELGIAMQDIGVLVCLTGVHIKIFLGTIKSYKILFETIDFLSIKSIDKLIQNRYNIWYH